MANFGAIVKTLKEYQGAAVNTAIVGATAAIEAIIKATVYSCPCVEASKVTNCGVGFQKNSCAPTLLNYTHGLSYIVAPAVVLFFVGVAATPKIWKLWTGCCAEKDVPHRLHLHIRVVMEVSARGLVSPLSWICFAFLDGNYLACAITPFPYDVKPIVPNKSCFDVSNKIGYLVPYKAIASI